MLWHVPSSAPQQRSGKFCRVGCWSSAIVPGTAEDAHYNPARGRQLGEQGGGLGFPEDMEPMPRPTTSGGAVASVGCLARRVEALEAASEEGPSADCWDPGLGPTGVRSLLHELRHLTADEAEEGRRGGGGRAGRCVLRKRRANDEHADDEAPPILCRQQLTRQRSADPPSSATCRCPHCCSLEPDGGNDPRALLSRAEWAAGALAELSGERGCEKRAAAHYQASTRAWPSQAISPMRCAGVSCQGAPAPASNRISNGHTKPTMSFTSQSIHFRKPSCHFVLTF